MFCAQSFICGGQSVISASGSTATVNEPVLDGPGSTENLLSAGSAVTGSFHTFR